MGQLALGLRSLVIRFGVFVVLAALLAWALGGTLFPRPSIVEFDAVEFAGGRWYWQLAVGGREADRVAWRMMVDDETGEAHALRALDEQTWSQVAGPVRDDDVLYFAGRFGATWRIYGMHDDRSFDVYKMPDRLAVEQQLARLDAGLPLQDIETIRRQRDDVLNPTETSSDIADTDSSDEPKDNPAGE